MGTNFFATTTCAHPCIHCQPPGIHIGNGAPADWVAEGERRALREWQQTHREPCDDCTWVEVQAMCDPEPRHVLDHACPKHGGNQ